MFGHGDTGLMWLMSIEHIHLVIYIFCLSLYYIKI